MNCPDGFVEISLPSPSGVRLWMRDETATYGYSNIYTVRLRVRLGMPGHPAAHERLLERMGVYADRRDAVRGELLGRFCDQIAPYLTRPEFGERLAQRGRDRRLAASTSTGYT